MTLQFSFDNSYAALPERFFVRQPPAPVAKPEILLLNNDLAELLGLPPEDLARSEGLAVLSGNAVPEGADPLAQAYAGHQFGGFVPQLGDGRAVLLGEIVGRDGVRRDIQLKGAGRTPFSRMGDGRAWLGPVLREYIVSEAMHALGVPTTRALAAVATGETVLREAPLPGAVLTRVAQSHIRVGTFQYFAARQDTDAIRALADHVIARHYPDAGGALDLLKAVIARQSRLVAQWMGLGFVHGVMNTDNTQVAGETIDYGPCAFMEAFDPATVFSSIDQYGRYAYNRQPEIVAWNLAQLASCLLPLIDEDESAAIDQAQAAIQEFPDLFRADWAAVFGAKLGLTTREPDDTDLIEGLLQAMAKGRADFTNTFRALSGDRARDEFLDPAAFDAWEAGWRARLEREPAGAEARMRAANPALIPRNHRVEEAIRAAVDGDLGPARRMIAALAHPYADPSPEFADLARPAQPDEAVRQTFCGT